MLRSRHEVLDAQIRAKIAADKGFAQQMKVMGRVSAQMVEGQTKVKFQCYNFASGQYDQRDATLKAIGRHCYIFLADDSSTLAGQDPVTNINQVKTTFDEKVYPTVLDWFGPLNLPNFGLPDDKIYILLLDIRDGIGGGYVAGYFDSRDLEGDFGNRKPLFFMDLNPGKTGDPSDKNNDFYRTLAHEFQHMINFSYHLPQNGRSQEERWVEEGLSGLSEYLYTTLVGNDGIGLPPSPHLSKFLENPSIVLTQNSDSEWFAEATLFRHYGASFLFIYYLRDALGGADDTSKKAFIRSLVDNGATGVTGLDSVFSKLNTSFVEVLKNWFIANHLNDVSLNNGLWGYKDKETRLGAEAAGLPISGNTHTFSAGGLSFVGGEGRAYSNSARYEDIHGSGNLNLLFKGMNKGFTPYVATVDFSNYAQIQSIPLSDGLSGNLALDLSALKRVVLVPAAITTQTDVTDSYYYNFSGVGSKVVVYPVPNPVFSNEFMIVLKSLEGAISGNPTVSVTFNNIQSSPGMTPTDDTRKVFVANYSIPGAGEGQVKVTVGDVRSSFTFYGSILRSNSKASLKIKDVEFSVSSRVDNESVYLYESALAVVPDELQIISKPYFAAFNSKNAVEARLLYENPALPVDRPTQVGLWSNQNASSSWMTVSLNERGYYCPVAHEGLYVLVADRVAPKIHDLHIDHQNDAPALLARISDGGSGINHDSVRVEVDGKSLPFSFDDGKAVLTADLSRLPAGQHRFEVSLQDFAENRGRAILSQILAGPLTVVQVTSYPNPSKGAANLAVMLDGNGADDATLDVEARIYDVSGKKIVTLPLSYKSNRTYLARWDQRNEDGKQVANGLYPFKIIIRRGGEELKANGKLAVLN